MQINQDNELAELCNQACSALDIQVKLSAIARLAEAILQDTMNPEKLYYKIRQFEESFLQWEVNCFVLVEIIHDNVSKLTFTQVQRYIQCIMQVLKELYRSPYSYNVPGPNNQIQIVKPYIFKSLKRTLSELLKYLLVLKAKVKDYFPLYSIITTSKNTKLQPHEKHELYLMVEIGLSLIEVLEIRDAKMTQEEFREINEEFQRQFVGGLLGVLLILIQNLDTDTEIEGLVASMEKNLFIKDNSHNTEEKHRMWNVELPFQLLDSLLNFNYSSLRNPIPASRGAFSESNSSEPSSIIYPKEVTLLVGNSNFLGALFRLANSFTNSIQEAIENWLKYPETSTTISKNNIKVNENLKYFKQVVESISQIAQTQLYLDYNLMEEKGEEKSFLFELMKQLEISEEMSYSHALIETIFNQTSNLFFEAEKLKNLMSQIQVNENSGLIQFNGKQCPFYLNISNTIRHILLSQAESIFCVFYRLTNNAEFSEVLSNESHIHSKITGYERVVHFFTLIETLSSWCFEYGESITLSSFFGETFEDPCPTVDTIVYGKTCFYRKLSKFWQSAGMEREQINNRIKFMSTMEQIKGQPDYGHAIVGMILRVIGKFIKKLITQNVSVLSNNSFGSCLFNLSELKPEISEFYRLLSKTIKLNEEDATLAILHELSSQLQNLNLKISHLESQLPISSSTVQEIVSSHKGATNLMLAYLYIIIPLAEFGKEKQKCVMDALNGIDHSHLFAKIKADSDSIEEESMNCLSKYLGILQNGQIDIESTSIIYLCGSMLNTIYSWAFTAPSNRDLLMRMEQVYEEKVIIKIDPRLIKTLETITENCILIPKVSKQLFWVLSFFAKLFTSKYLPRLRFLLEKASGEETEIQGICQIIVEILTEVEKVCEEILAASKDYLELMDSYSKKIIARNQSTLLIHKLQSNKNVLEEIKKLFLMFCETLLGEIEIAYSIAYKKNKVGKLEENLLKIHQSLVKISGKILLFHNPNTPIDHKSLQNNFEICSRLLKIPFIKQNLTESSEFQPALEVCVSGLNGFFTSLSESYFSSSAIPILFITFIEKEIGINHLMRTYGQILILNSDSFSQYSRMHKLIKLSIATLESVCQHSHNNNKSAHMKFNFMKICLPFWTSSLTYVNNAELNVEKMLENWSEVIVSLLELIKSITDKNRSSINFELFRREDAESFDNFFLHILKLLSTLFTAKEIRNGRIHQVMAEIEIVENAANKALLSISKISYFIFSLNGWAYSPSKVNQESLTLFLNPYTSTIIAKIHSFLVNFESVFIPKNIKKAFESPREGSETHKLCKIEEDLRIIKIVFCYLQRAVLYKHNLGLQENILYFLNQININSFQSPSINNNNKFPVFDSLFEGLIKWGLILVQFLNGSGFYINITCEIIISLPSLFSEYLQKNQTIAEDWQRKPKEILQRIIGCNEKSINRFFHIWEQCMIDKISYEEEVDFLKNWFNFCVGKNELNDYCSENRDERIEKRFLEKIKERHNYIVF